MSFDALAPLYPLMESLLAGGKLQRCRTAWLDEVAGADTVLVAGEGPGRFLAECRRNLPRARITCLDASARMLSVARGHLHHCGLSCDGVEFIHADALAWAPPRGKFDLVVTHFFLDCFTAEQLGILASSLACAAAPSADWLLADFQIPPQGWRRLRARVIHRLMYAFFRAAARLPARELTPPDPLLRSHGFHLAGRQVSEWGLLHSDLWQRETAA